MVTFEKNLKTTKMKKTVIILALAISIVSCQKGTELKESKTAYVDTSKLLDQYTEAKDIQEKFKAKSEEMGRELEVEVSRFKADAANFQKVAQQNGEAWAQQNGAALQQRQDKLQYAQQAMVQQLQQEMAVEMDTLVSGVKKFVKAYGKEKGYNYIFGTGEAESILYAEDKNDLTAEMIKLLNDKYKSAPKTDSKAEAKKENQASEKKK